MRLSPLGKPNVPGPSRPDRCGIPRGITAVLMAAIAAGLLVPVRVSAQTAEAQKEPAAETKAATPRLPLAHFVQRDKLALYVEFDGLQSHEAEWKATAAYKMLTSTPLGVMLEQVAGQILEKAIAPFPNKTLTGAEIVTLIEHAAQAGFVLALNGDSADGTLRRTFVLRGGAGKEIRPIASRAMKWLMSDDKPRMEWKASRPLVLVSKEATNANPKEGWAWWAEKEDLAVVTPISTADHVIAAIDGSSPSATDHPLVQSLTKPEGEFHPVGVAFIDPSAPLAVGSRIAAVIKEMKDSWGMTQLDLRFGFETSALVTTVRMVAPRPRKPGAAVFDQPTFTAAGLLPTPEGVGSFVELSMKPAQVISALSALDSSGSVKSRIDAAFDAIRSGGKIDIEKDVLDHIGPRMILYLAPGRTAAATDDAIQAVLGHGLDLMAVVSNLQAHFPKLTLVAEVSDPETLGKSLDTVMIAVNNQLKIVTIEKAAEDRAAEKAKNNNGGGESGARKRSPESAVPRFTVAPSSGSTKTYVLTTPSSSPLKLGAAGFRPAVLLEGKHLVISTSSDAARAAMTAIKRKDWKPAESTSQAIGRASQDLVALGVTDAGDSLPTFLASFPGTVQAMINTALAVAKNRATTPAAGAPGTSPPPGGAAPGGNASVSNGAGGGEGGRRGRMGPGGIMAPGGQGGNGAPGGTGFGFGGQNSNNSNTNGLSADEMLTLAVETDKLPKAEELKGMLFPGLVTISVTDREIRLTSRSAFPNLGSPFGAIAGALLLPNLAQARATAAAAAAASAAAATESQPAPGAPGAPAGGPGRPGGGPGFGAPGGAPSTSAPGGAPAAAGGGKRGRRGAG